MTDDLVEYGIYQENSDVRVHVCPYVERVYVFPTQEGIRALEENDYKALNAYQDGVSGRTAIGYGVPPDDIQKCICVRVRRRVWAYLSFTRSASTSEKGGKAVRLVVGMIQRGMLPLPGRTTQDPTMEIDGTDIVAHFEEQTLNIQVKCDFRGGHKELGGLGGLFLQTHERNPRGLHDGEQQVSHHA